MAEHSTEKDAPRKVCGCRCHGGHVGTACRQNRCEKCVIPPAKTSLEDAR